MKMSSDENVEVFATWCDFLRSVLENSQVTSDSVLSGLFCPSLNLLLNKKNIWSTCGI